MAIAICALTWAVFGQALAFDFVSYDDTDLIFRTPQVARGLTLSGIAWAFTHTHAQNWNPLTTITHMIDCSVWGLHAAGPHAVNVLLHSFTAALLLVAFTRMTGAVWQSAFVAALFAIHPAHVESVAWIAERKDTLSGLFFAITLWTYTRYVANPTRRKFLWVGFALVAGLLAKPMLVTIPFLLLLLDYWPLQRFTRQAMLEKIPLVILAVASSAATLFFQQSVVAGSAIPLPFRLENAAVSYAIYLRQLFWPRDLVPLYLHPVDKIATTTWGAALALIITLSAIAIVLRRRAPYVFVGWFWFAGMLVPVIGIVQVGMHAHADRYTYLPFIGLFVVLTWAATEFAGSIPRRQTLLVASSAIVLLILSGCAFRQVRIWRNSDTLWTHSLAVDPDNDAAHASFAAVLFEKGRTMQGVAHMRRAVELRPSNAGRYGGGALSLGGEQLEKGVEFWLQAVQEQPDDLPAQNTLGALLMQQHRPAEAISIWEHALTQNPNDGNAQSNLAWALAACPEARLRNGTRALELITSAMKLPDATSPILYRTLAAAYAECGRFDDAIGAANEGRKLARVEGNTSLSAELDANLALFRQHQPIRDESMSQR